MALTGIARGGGQEFGHAEDAVHWRPDLMAHIGEEFRLGSAGSLRSFLCQQQFLCGTFERGDVGSDAEVSRDRTVGLP